MTVTIKQLRKIIKDLKKQNEELEHEIGASPDENRKWMVAIVNKQ